VREFIEEVKEEFFDFVEDFGDLVKHRAPRKDVHKKPAVIGGQLTVIRPAYLFAERVDNGLKILFGVSVLLSAATSTFVGFSSLSGLVEVLIQTLLGRLALLVIGLSYLIVAVWKTLHLNHSQK
jgi:hypothetical protein